MNTDLTQARTSVKHPFLVMMALYFGAFIGMFSETSLNIALPVLINEFKIDTGVAQWMVIRYMLVIGLVLPFVSFLMKWFSVRKLTIFALACFAIGCIISGTAMNFPLLLGGRMLQGVGTGLVLPMMFSMVLEVFPPYKIGRMMGLTALIIMFAPAIGPTLSGIILGTLSWRWLFFLFAIVLVIGLVFGIKYMVSPYELTKKPLDILSVITSCLGFGGLVAGVGLASVYGWGSMIVIGLLVIGILALCVYGYRQFALETPVLNLHAFQIPQFRIGALLVMIDFGITLSTMFLLPQFLQNGLLLPVAMTGIVMLPGGVVNALVSLFAGTLYDKIGAKLPACLGFLISIVGAALLWMTTKESTILFVIICHVLLMIGVPLAMSPSQSAALNSLPPELSTDGSTILNTMQQVLGAICTAIATSLLGLGQQAYFATGSSDSVGAFINGTHYGVLFALVLAVIGLLLAFKLKAKDKNSK